MSWNDPDRFYGPPLPKALKKRVLREHNGICHWCLKPGAGVVDHIVNRRSGGSDDPSNLAPIHPSPCHVEKTAQEANAARRKRSHREPPQHPGKRKT